MYGVCWPRGPPFQLRELPKSDRRRRRIRPTCRHLRPAAPPRVACRQAAADRVPNPARSARRASTRRRLHSRPRFSSAGSDQIDGAFHGVAVDDDLDQVAVEHLADRPPASASGDTCPMQAPVETPLKRASVMTATCFPNVEVLQRRSELIGLLHPRAHRPAADQHEDSPASIADLL